MAKSRKWYAGKTFNPEFLAAARAHSSECAYCGSFPYSSRKDFNTWVNNVNSHSVETLPEAFPDEAPKVNPNLSGAQGNWRNDIITREKDDE